MLHRSFNHQDTYAMAQLTGPHLSLLVPALARLRISVFREWPYLYDGSMDYESKYLRTYIESPEAVAVLVFHPDVPKNLSAEELASQGDRLIGASTGLPLADETEEFKQPFIDQGHDPERIYYFGESILLPEYRGQGLGKRLFQEREAFATGLGRFDQFAFCAVQRPEKHPQRPADYQPLDDFWYGQGYQPQPELVAHYRWLDVGDKKQSEKPMQFWIKSLSAS